MLFVQSHVPAHTELAWLFATITPMNWAERMIQYKEKKEKQGEETSVGLFSYPILQAADILLYQPKYVPVGRISGSILSYVGTLPAALMTALDRPLSSLRHSFVRKGRGS